MIEKGGEISISKQCRLLDLHRGGLYYTPASSSAENLAIMRKLDEWYFDYPFYGARRLTQLLKHNGYQVNNKRVKRLMRIMGWQTIYREPNTSLPNKAHKKYPYLLKNIEINRANQVWAIDITYIPMQRGFMFLCAIIDVYTRYVVNWSLSNTMTAEWCREVVAQAVEQHGAPEIINSDQGSQFTSHEYISLLKEQNIQISMDGKGRAIDNIFIERLWRSVKYENVYLHSYENGTALYNGLKKYFWFYNQERFHQSLGYATPAALYLKKAA